MAEKASAFFHWGWRRKGRREGGKPCAHCGRCTPTPSPAAMLGLLYKPSFLGTSSGLCFSCSGMPSWVRMAGMRSSPPCTSENTFDVSQ